MRGTEVKAVGELAGEALSGAAGIVGDVHRGVSRRVFGMLGPVAAPVRARRTTGSPRSSTPRCGPVCARCRAAAAARSRSPRPGTRRRWPTTRAGRSRSARSTACGATGSSATTPRSRSGWTSATPAARPRASRSSSTGCARPTRRGGSAAGPDLRRAAARGPRPHARLRPLQHRPPHLRQRPRAGGGAGGARRGVAGRGRGARARRALDGRPRRAQRLPLRRVRRPRLDGAPAPRLLPRLAAPRRAARARAQRAAATCCGRLPETAPLARCSTVRSAGIKDLRYGACLEEDWNGRRPRRVAPRPLRGLPVPAERDLLLRRRDDRARQGRSARRG